jgi:hypothetical protein
MARTLYRKHWRDFLDDIDGAVACRDAAAFKSLKDKAIRSQKWILPTSSLHDGAIFLALSSAVFALSRNAEGPRTRVIESAVLGLVDLCAQILDRSNPPQAADGPRRAYRADIDG